MMAALESTGLRGELLFGEPMSKHTSWRVGGPAERFYRPADGKDLAAFLAGLPSDEPLLWLGLGSNLLVRDGGFKGTVVALRGRLDSMLREGEGRLRVEAGVPCAKVARFAARHGLCGAEFLAGIPGTMGGALAMNAGAFGGETWRLVVDVQTVDRTGHLRLRAPGEFDVAYRTVNGPQGEWFLAARLQLELGDVESGQRLIRELLARRSATQPTNQPSCGSVFRNPPGDHAARLIESAGLKGCSLGGARVSPRHANFIVNTGNATAYDIEMLINHVRSEVERVHGLRLQLEAHVVGDPA